MWPSFVLVGDRDRRLRADGHEGTVVARAFAPGVRARELRLVRLHGDVRRRQPAALYGVILDHHPRIDGMESSCRRIHFTTQAFASAGSLERRSMSAERSRRLRFGARVRSDRRLGVADHGARVGQRHRGVFRRAASTARRSSLPRISPKKTLEGSAGAGFAAAVVGSRDHELLSCPGITATRCDCPRGAGWRRRAKPVIS